RAMRTSWFRLSQGAAPPLHRSRRLQRPSRWGRLRAAMSFIGIAILLGIVEGLTEFLPVSSTGHLIVAGHLLGFTGETSETFEIFIQLGAILAVVVLERERFLALLSFRGQGGFAGPRGCALLLTTTLPALVAGALLHGWIRAHLFGPVTVA